MYHFIHFFLIRNSKFLYIAYFRTKWSKKWGVLYAFFLLCFYTKGKFFNWSLVTQATLPLSTAAAYIYLLKERDRENVRSEIIHISLFVFSSLHSSIFLDLYILRITRRDGLVFHFLNCLKYSKSHLNEMELCVG